MYYNRHLTLLQHKADISSDARKKKSFFSDRVTLKKKHFLSFYLEAKFFFSQKNTFFFEKNKCFFFELHH